MTPAALRRFALRLWSFFRAGRAEDDLAREMNAHLQLLEDAFAARGMSPADARAAARRAFGGVEQAKERYRDARSFRWLHDARADVRYAVRVLLGNPRFAATAIATLALGIGASAAIFSVAYGIAVRPLPYAAPDRLVRIYEANPANAQLKHDVSIGAFQAWRGAPSIESAALFAKPDTRFLAGAEGAPVRIMRVSASLFDVLGVKPFVGPGFAPEQEYTRFNGNRDGVLSYAAWQRLFGGRADIIGRHLEFSGISKNDACRIVGVMPEAFTFDQAVDLWQPSLVVETPMPRLFRLWRYDRAVARLRPGASIEQARAELETTAWRLAREFPATNNGWTVTVESLHASIVGNFARASWLLLASVMVVLLVACVNIGGLLMGRAIARRRENSVRVALGAGAWRLVRQWMVEAAILSATGAALGVVLAWTGVSAMKSAAPPGIPRLDSVLLDLPVLVMCMAATLVAMATFTIFPAATLKHRDLTGGLRTGSAGGEESRSGHRARMTLVTAQCAGATALMVLAVMLTRGYIRLTAVDPGWNPAGVLSLKASPPMPPGLLRPWSRYVDWSDRLVARLQATPGIRRAAVTTQIPLSPQSYPSTVATGRGKGGGDDARWPGVTHSVTDGYFDTMQIRLINGRTFGDADRFSPAQLFGEAKRDHGVAIVTETAARTLWPDRPAIGQALWLPDIDTVAWREVVGIVEDIQFNAIGESPALHVFVPWTEYPTGNPRVVVKGAGTGASIATIVRGVAGSVEPGTHIDEVVPLDDLVARSTAQPRFTSRIVSLFGALALFLSAVGIYGTLSYVVSARTREIGIRLALGASRAHILTETVWRGLAPAAIGAIAGVITAVALARTFRALFFDVSPFDETSLGAGGILLLAVAVLAAFGPAHRATKVDPAYTLRAE